MTQINLPDELRCEGRPTVAPLDPESLLYKRYKSGEVINGKLAPDSIRLPDFSVNSGQFSRPEHVLFPYYSGLHKE